MRTFYTILAILIAGAIGFSLGNSSAPIEQRAVAADPVGTIQPLTLSDLHDRVMFHQSRLDMILQLISQEEQAFLSKVIAISSSGGRRTDSEFELLNDGITLLREQKDKSIEGIRPLLEEEQRLVAEAGKEYQAAYLRAKSQLVSP